MTRAKIIGMGAYAPKRVLSNADLEKMVETSHEWIVQRSGIHERRIVDEGEATSDLAVRAAQQALERANLVPEDIDFIVVGTTTPDMFFPSTGNIVQHRLGCRRVGSVDVLAACAASIYSLIMGARFIEVGKYRRVLCIGAETLSRITDFTDRGTCVLLADAAGAAVLEASEDGSGLLDGDLYSDGQYWDLLYMPGGGSRIPATAESVAQRQHYAKMKGSEVFKVAVRMFVEATSTLLQRHGVKAEDIDLFIPHQANLRIIEAASKRLNLPSEKVFVNIEKYGNTGAASVPIALCEAIEQGRVYPGAHLGMVAFGAGLTWAAAVVKWTAPVLP